MFDFKVGYGCEIAAGFGHLRLRTNTRNENTFGFIYDRFRDGKEFARVHMPTCLLPRVLPRG